MNDPIKHYVNDMDESMIQNCIFCGETISDYSQVMYMQKDGPPKGFPAGDVFVINGNPTLLTTSLSNGVVYKDCSTGKIKIFGNL